MPLHWSKGMRDYFFQSLFHEAEKNRDILLMTADIGAICHDDFKNKLGNQYINIGIAEQNMIGVAAGLALSGKIVYVYSIVPFVTMRCLEQIRIDLCCMNLPVTIVSIGAGVDYSTLGASHHGTEDIGIMRALPNMTIYCPSDGAIARLMATIDKYQMGPRYIRLDRTGLPLIYKKEKDINLNKGLSIICEGKDLYIIATGRMVYNALKVAEVLREQSIDVGVIDLFRIKPLNEKAIWNVIHKIPYVITLEEHSVIGGIGSAISEIFAVKEYKPKLKIMGIPDRFCKEYGTREYLQSIYELDIHSIKVNIEKWIKK